jgi:hypothetical protein
MLKGNSHIGCEVTDWKYNAKDDMAYRLDHIGVVKHGNSAKTRENTVWPGICLILSEIFSYIDSAILSYRMSGWFWLGFSPQW